jgi:hypothetical protein
MNTGSMSPTAIREMGRRTIENARIRHALASASAVGSSGGATSTESSSEEGGGSRAAVGVGAASAARSVVVSPSRDSAAATSSRRRRRRMPSSVPIGTPHAVPVASPSTKAGMPRSTSRLRAACASSPLSNRRRCTSWSTGK